VAFLQLRAAEAARAWVELVERRRVGKGRRPSPREVERAAKRAALDDETAVCQRSPKESHPGSPILSQAGDAAGPHASR
jgi:hypothetical protein